MPKIKTGNINVNEQIHEKKTEITTVACTVYKYEVSLYKEYPRTICCIIHYTYDRPQNVNNNCEAQIASIKHH